MKYTGERLITTVFNDNTISHLHRYAIALTFIKGKTVLDIASGEGYGSNLLSSDASYVYGVDIDAEIIKNASIIYKRDNLEFLQGSTSEIPLSDNSVDVVVSFETLEHHDKHEEMMLEIKRVLRPKGSLLISTPDKYFYSELRNLHNEFHIKELYKDEFTKLISRHFKNYKLYSQSYIYGSSIVLEDEKRDCFEFYTGNYTELKKTDSNPNYLIVICSDFDFQNINSSLFEGKSLIDNKELENKLRNIYDSHSYKLGHYILLPLKYLKRFF